MTLNQACFLAYHAHITLPHGTRPTALHLKIYRLAARWQHRCPSHGRLAKAAGCCRRTVQNALNRYRGLGLISWRHQGCPRRFGGVLQLCNRYAFDASYLLSSCPNLPSANIGPQPPIRSVAEQLRLLAIG